MKKISLLYVLLFVATATFFVSTKLSNAQVSTTTATTTGTTVSTSTPYLKVLSPLGNRIHLFGSRVHVAWNVENVNADYYYVLLENKALENVGFVVSDNISPSTTTTNFEFNKNILNTVLANSGGLTEGQLKDGYYVRVIGIKKGTPYNSAVVNGVSGVFSVSNSLGLIVSNMSAKLGSPVTSGNITVAQPYEMSLTITNNSQEAVYIRNVGDNRDAIFTSSINSATSSNVIAVTSPNTLAGDGINSLVIPVGMSRKFVYTGSIRNSGSVQQITFNMSGINYGKSNNWPNGYILDVTSPELRVFPIIGTNQSTSTGTTTSTTTTPYLEIVSPVGNRNYLFGSRIYIAWNARNTDADFYYALLENTAIKDFGFVVADNISPSTTTVNFLFNKNVIDTMLSSRVGLTEAQLQNGYYVRIIGVKKDLPYSRAVINTTSGVFSISNSSELVVSNTSAKLGGPVIANNIPIAQPYEMSLTITNYSNDAVYIRNKGDGRDVVFNTTPYTATSTSPIIIASPAKISGDGINYFMIPVGASRTFSYYGSLKNSGSLSMVSHEMVGIVSGKSNVWPEGHVIPVPQGKLKLGTILESNNIDKSPVIKNIKPTPNPTPTNTSVIPSSNNSMRVISPNGGEVLKKGSLVNIYYNKKPNDGSYRTDMYLIANDSQSVYTIQGKAGGTGIYDPSLGDSVVMYGWMVGEGSIINGVATSNIPAGYYKLKVCLTGTSVCDLSDRAFAITETTAPVYSSTPTPIPAPYYSSTPTVTPIPVYSSTPIPTPYYSPTPTVTPVPVYSSTPSPTPTPTPYYSPTPMPTYSPVISSSPSPSSTPRPSTSPVSFDYGDRYKASIWSSVLGIIFGK